MLPALEKTKEMLSLHKITYIDNGGHINVEYFRPNIVTTWKVDDHVDMIVRDNTRYKIHWVNRNVIMLYWSNKLIKEIIFLNKKLTKMYGIGRLVRRQYEDVIRRVWLMIFTKKENMINRDKTKRTSCNTRQLVNLRELNSSSLVQFILNISRWILLFKEIKTDLLYMNKSYTFTIPSEHFMFSNSYHLIRHHIISNL